MKIDFWDSEATVLLEWVPFTLFSRMHFVSSYLNMSR
jgi:hypothetical protein